MFLSNFHLSYLNLHPDGEDLVVVSPNRSVKHFPSASKIWYIKWFILFLRQDKTKKTT